MSSWHGWESMLKGLPGIKSFATKIRYVLPLWKTPDFRISRGEKSLIQSNEVGNFQGDGGTHTVDGNRSGKLTHQLRERYLEIIPFVYKAW